MGTFWEHFTEIITDPAHTAVEFLFVLLDYLVIGVVVHRVRRHFHRDMAGAGDVGTPLVMRGDGLYLGDIQILNRDQAASMFATAVANETVLRKHRERSATDEVPVS